MNLRHLEILREVAGCASFTRAAERLYLTQSAVSHAVRALERQAGTPLVERGARTVRLTPAGALLVERAAPLLSACRQLEQELPRLEQSAPLRLASCITAACSWLPEGLKAFEYGRPGAHVEVQVAPAAAVASFLAQGDADAALLEGSVPEGAFEAVRLASYRLAAVCAPEDPAAGRCLTPREFCALPLLLREPGSAVRDALDSALLLEGCKARCLWQSISTAALCRAAQSGLGAAVIPRPAALPLLEKGMLREIRLKGIRLENPVWLLRREDSPRTPALEELERALRAAAERSDEN